MEKTKPQGRPSAPLPKRICLLDPTDSGRHIRLVPQDDRSHTPRPRRGRHNRRGTTFQVLTPHCNRKGPPMILPGNGDPGGKGGGRLMAILGTESLEETPPLWVVRCFIRLL